MENNEMIVSSRIAYLDYKSLHEIRHARGEDGRKPSISELIREAITTFIREQNEQSNTQ